MVKYLHEVNDEKFAELRTIRNNDNIESAQYLSDIANRQEDARYNLSLLHLGIMMQILSTTLDIKQGEIQELFEKGEDTRNKKMEGIIKELNDKINLRYGFDDKVEIIPCLYSYQGEGHFVCCKLKFLKLLNKEQYDEIDILDNL